MLLCFCAAQVTIPGIRPLETLHNALSLRQLDAFLGFVTSAASFRAAGEEDEDVAAAAAAAASKGNKAKKTPPPLLDLLSRENSQSRIEC